jgi:hypothetical protein
MKFNLFLLSAAAMVNTASGSDGDVHLGTAGDYAILAKSGISTTTGSTITGDIAVSPIAATAITGFNLALDSGGFFSTAGMLTGNAYAASYGGATAAALTTAVGDMEVAYTDSAGRSTGTTITNEANNQETVQLFNAEYGKVCLGSENSDINVRNCFKTVEGTKTYVYENLDPFLNLKLGEIGGLKLAPGVYTFDKQVNIADKLTFVGGPDDVFIIQTSKGVKQADGKDVVLEDNAGILSTDVDPATTYNGPKPENIFWSVAGSVVVGEGSVMNGVLLVKTKVTIGTLSTVNGRILAQTAVALDEATITQLPL